MKKTVIVMTIILMLAALLLHAPLATAATDGYYQLSEVTAGWDGTDASRTKAPTSDYDYTYGDESSVTYTLPWAFTFYGQSYSAITADTNGNVWFSATGSAHSFDLASTGRGPVIAAWNSDLSSYFYEGVFIQHKTNPERVVIEWQTETYRDESYGRQNSFEVVIFANGTIRTDYRAFDAPTATDSGSGISKGDGTASLNLSSNYGNAYSLAGRSFLFAGGQRIYLPRLTENLGDTLVGVTSSPHAIPVYNAGTDNLQINSVTLAAGSAFSLVAGSDTCTGAILLPGQSCTVQAVFAPGSPGAQSSTLTVSSGDPGTPTIDVTLSGTGLYPTLSVAKSDIGAGTVASSPAGISCGTACTAQFPTASSVTLTATADTGSVFTGWSGACTGTGDCIVTMDATKGVTASFTPVTHPIVTITSPSGQIVGNRPMLQYSASTGTVAVTVDSVVVNKVSGDLLDTLSDGSHVIRVEATNAAGYTGFAESTVIVDTLPLTFTSNPAAEGQNVPVNTDIVLSFTEAIDTSSIAQNSITLASPFGNVAGTVKISTDARTLTFKPSVQLGYNRVHTVTLKAGLRDLLGNTNSSDSSFTFTTEAAATDLVGLWHMDNDWSDASGKGNNGTPINGTSIVADYINGTGSGAFDGNNDSMEVPSATSINLGTKSFSIEYWLKVNGPLAASKEYGLVNKNATYQNSAGWGTELSTYGVPDGKYYVQFYITNQTAWGNTNAGSSSLDVGKWYHVVGVREGTVTRMYVNGALASSKTHANAALNVDNTQKMIFGKNVWGVYAPVQLDRVALYSRVLSDQEIAEHAAAVPVIEISSPGETAYYRSGDTATATVSVTHPTGVASLACTASGAASDSFSLDFDTPETSVTHEFSFQVAPNALSASSISINCTCIDSDKNIGRGTLTLTLSDTAVPVATGSSIPDNATGVVLSTPIRIDFSEPLAPDTVNASSVTFTNVSSGNQSVAGQVALSADRNSISFLPTAILSADTNYRFTVSTLVTDEVGNHLPQDYSIQFTTQSVEPLTITNKGSSADPYIVNGNGFSSVVIDNSYVLFYGPVVASSISLTNNSTITHFGATTTDEFLLDLSAESISIDSTSKIDVRGKGYLGGWQGGNSASEGRTYGNTNSGGSTTGSGGSYGGLGGRINGSVNSGYGSIGSPQELGSGGGGSNTTYRGGNGGGSVKIATDTFTMDGSILADGNGGGSGAGSGGGVLITAGVLSGSGIISAQGGASDSNNGAGGGGRIAIHYDSNTLPAANLKAYGGKSGDGSNSGRNGGAGTIYLKYRANTKPEIVINNNGVATSSTTVVPGGDYVNITLVGGAAATMVGSFTTEQDLVVVGSQLTTSDSFASPGNVSLTNSTMNISGGGAIPGNLTMDNSTLSAKDTLTVGGAVSLTNQSVLSHYGATTSEAWKLDIQAVSVNIDSTSKIDVSGKGYLGGWQNGNGSTGRTLGNTTTGGSSTRNSASYGALAGVSWYGGSVNGVYGDLGNPNEVGSGGGGDSSYAAGGNGGGLVRLQADTLTLDGAILADGKAGAYYYYYNLDSHHYGGSGSGGGIWLNVGSLAGSGSINARGGASVYNTNIAGGGGGRIAINYDIMTLPVANVNASGGKSMTGSTAARNGGAGTIYLKDNARPKPELIIASGGVITSNMTTVPGGDYVGMTVAGGAAITMSGNTSFEQDVALSDTLLSVSGTLTLPGNLSLNKSSLTLKDNLTVTVAINLSNQSVLSHYGATTSEAWKLDIQAATISIDSSSKIDVSGKGYLGGLQNGNGSTGRTLGNTTTGGSSTRNSASFGGLAGTGQYGGTFNGVYGELANPIEAGSGGGGDSGSYGSAKGGNGGGLVRLQAGTLTLDGSIYADGIAGGYASNSTWGAYYYGGSGSGGGIWINAGSLSGTGSITARGGASTYNAGIAGGGGGRIAIFYDSMTLPIANINAAGGKSMTGSNSSRNGGAGTIYLKDNATYGDVIIANGDFATTYSTIVPTASYRNIDVKGKALASLGDAITLSGDLSLDGGTATGYGAISTSGAMTLKNTAMLTHYGATTTATYKLDLTAGSVDIDATSKIDVSGKGYLGGRRSGNNTDTGRTIGNTNAGASTISNGGSYGGLGGRSTWNGTVNAVYGNLQQPNELGSGGGANGSSYPGGSGGGLVKITSGALNLAGSIFADGGSSSSSGGGSGGGIQINVGTLSGTGSVYARGGGVSGNTIYGSGGGGRIALYYNSSSLPLANIAATGGTSGNGSRAASNGAAGTIYTYQYLFPLTVNVIGTGGGSVQSTPAGLTCSSSCSSEFAKLSSVTFTPTPNTGSLFAGWSGACSGSGACVVTMDAAKSVTAEFTQVPPPVVRIYSPKGATKYSAPVLRYSVSAGAVVVKVDDVVVNKVSGNTLDTLADGTHTVSVEATHAGLTTSAVSSFTIDPNLPPISLGVTPVSVPSDYADTVGMTVGNIDPVGSELLIEQFVDANQDGVVDAGDYSVRSFKVTDGIASENPNIQGDEDALDDGVAASTLSYRLVKDLYHAPGSYLFRVTNGAETAVAPFTVTPVASAQSVSGAVVADAVPLPGSLVRVLDKWQRPITWTLADAAGNYSAGIPAPGDYLIAPVAYGYSTASVQTPVSIASSQNLTGHTLNLTAGTVHVTGTVKGINNEPVIGVWVQGIGDNFTGYAMTSPDGSYDLVLPAGEYRVAPVADETIPNPSAKGHLAYKAASQLVNAQADSSGIDFQLESTDILITGNVSSPAGSPLGGLPVQGKRSATAAAEEPVSFSATDSDGNYSLALAPGAGWSISLEDSAAQSIGVLGTSINDYAAGNPLTGNNLTAQNVTGYIQGTVIGTSGAPLGNVEMQLRNADSSIVVHMRTAADGTYRFGAFGGDWFVNAVIDKNGPRPVGEQSATLQNGETVIVNFVADDLPPELTVNPVQSPTSLDSQTISGTREADSTVSVTMDTTATAGPVTFPTSTTWSCDIAGLVEGTNTLNVSAMDAMGNVSNRNADIVRAGSGP